MGNISDDDDDDDDDDGDAMDNCTACQKEFEEEKGGQDDD